ncbi:ATP-dependent RNA helicase HrpA [Bounagaea algeriensis]
METSAATTPSLSELRERVGELMTRDQQRLRKRLDGARKIRDDRKLRPVLGEIAADVAESEQRLVRRRARVPELDYPEELPVSHRRADLLETIRDNQVVIVAGETGSGKTTQLPKMCLELGRGVHGTIGHTQPRRIAARTVAQRVADEVDSDLGDTVGYQVRFTERAGEDTLVKVMTDGILLAEIQHDRMLRRYDTIIIDEAHERGLNVDFLLGYLKQLLPKRPDLKVIITSATIDPERFSRHFGDAPIIEVSGRTYPVEVRYRPLVDDSDADEDVMRDQTQAISDAVDELTAEGPGDVLVFLSGEREIRDTAEMLRGRELPNTEILPLYARLSMDEQRRAFAPHSGRRIVLATNVAETSLTVPGIKYVIDPGTARISRYSHRTKVQRLPVEPISQASANQRKGRCGRVSAGICVRLYSEEDFLARPEFTDPEILRTNLASVILRMTSLGLGDVESFPFVEPPDRRQITDGVQLLNELGALRQTNSGGRKLTDVGRRIAELPVDPRLARMVLEGESNGCLHEVLVITTALSIQDPRERPAEQQEAADSKHGRFNDEESDFLSYVHLWRYLRERQRELSGNQFRKRCQAEFLNYLRVREWQDLYGQLRQLVKGMDMSLNDQDADAERVHRSLLAGLLSHVGVQDVEKKGSQRKRGPREFQGARNTRFAIFPGSVLAKKPPQWVMAAELVETTRLWARTCARIEPEWVERIAGDLVKRNYSEPHWEKRQAAVIAYEKVTLFGLPLVVGRKVNYGRIDPPVARELFIRHALVEGDWDTRHEFFHRNRETLRSVAELEDRARRRDIVVDDETLFDFYDRRVGSEVVSGRHFDTWWKKIRRSQPDLLTFDRSMLINAGSPEITEYEYPSAWRQDGHEFRLTYQFEPGADADGVTAHIPLASLNQVDGSGFDWQIPGLREDLVVALLRALPKDLRRNFVPAPDYARALLDRMRPFDGALVDALSSWLRQMTGVLVPRDSWDFERVPEHLKMTFRVVDDDGETVAEGKDLAALRRELAPAVSAELSAAADEMQRSGLSRWDFGELPGTFEQQRDGHRVRAYPALVDEGDTVGVRTFGTEDEQRRAHAVGLRRLVLLNVPSPVKSLQKGMSPTQRLALSGGPHRGLEELIGDCVRCAADRIIAEHREPVADEDSFNRLVGVARSQLGPVAAGIMSTVEKVLTVFGRVCAQLDDAPAGARRESLDDIREQLNSLVHPGFVAGTGAARLNDLVRYLLAVEQRLEKLRYHPVRDLEWMDEIDPVRARYEELLDAARRGEQAWESVVPIGWMLQELRVSVFAQNLGTAHSVSVKRLHRAMDKAAG